MSDSLTIDIEPLRPIDPSCIKLVMTGIEGQIIDTEDLHWEKTFVVAKEYGLISGTTDDEQRAEFHKLWMSDLIGIGDNAIYKFLADKFNQMYPTETPHPYGKVFLTEDKYLAQTLAHYKAALEDPAVKAKLEKAGAEFKEFYKTLEDRGIRVLIVTHAPGTLAELQLRTAGLNEFLTLNRLVASETLGFEKWGRKPDCFTDVAKFMGKQIPFSAENILVLDSPKYTVPASKLGYLARNVAQRSDERFGGSPPNAVTIPQLTQLFRPNGLSDELRL